VNKLFHKSFQVAKRIRSETLISSGRVSVASAAVKAAEATLSEGAGDSAAGAGSAGACGAWDARPSGGSEKGSDGGSDGGSDSDKGSYSDSDSDSDSGSYSDSDSDSDSSSPSGEPEKRSFRGLTALIIGAGEMASLLAAHLSSRELKKMIILSRSLGRATELASRFGAEVRTIPELGEALGESDLIFSAAGGGSLVLFKHELSPILIKRAGRPLRIFDLGVPRNVESSVAELPGVTLKNIDSFALETRLSMETRAREASRASLIIEDEVLKFRDWRSSLAAQPTIKDLAEKAEEARKAELLRTLSKNDFTDKEIASIDAMTKALVRRILHNPLMFTKSCHRHWRAEFNLGMIRRIFGLD
jgi:glutamyl-tRNA reductase